MPGIGGMSEIDEAIAKGLLMRHIDPDKFPELMRLVVTDCAFKATPTLLDEAEEMVAALNLMLELAKRYQWLLEASNTCGLPVARR